MVLANTESFSGPALHHPPPGVSMPVVTASVLQPGGLHAAVLRLPAEAVVTILLASRTIDAIVTVTMTAVIEIALAARTIGISIFQVTVDYRCRSANHK